MTSPFRGVYAALTTPFEGDEVSVSKLQDNIRAFNRSDLASSGIVALDDNNRVCRFVEKPTSEEVFSYLINAGIYILEPAIFKYIPPDTSCDFGRDIFPALLEGGEEIYGYRLTVPLFWIDTPEDYERAQKEIKEGRLG